MFESHFRACLCFQSKTCVFSVGPKKACRALCKRYDSNLKQKTCILIQKVPCSNLPEISPSFLSLTCMFWTENVGSVKTDCVKSRFDQVSVFDKTTSCKKK